MGTYAVLLFCCSFLGRDDEDGCIGNGGCGLAVASLVLGMTERPGKGTE